MERDLKGEIVTVKNLVGHAVALSTAAALVTAAPAAGATEQPEQSTPTTQSSQQQADSGDDSSQTESGSEAGTSTDSSGSGDSTSEDDSGSSDASGSGDGSTGDSGSGATEDSGSTGDSGSGTTEDSGSTDSTSGDDTGSGGDSGSDSGDSGDQVDEDPGAGKIDEYYQSLDAAEQERLGEPVGEEQVVSDSLRYQKYDNARIYWSADQGVHSVSGAVLDAFVNAGGHEALGVPSTGRKTDEAGTPYGEFVSSERGTSAIYAPEGAEAHVLGEPVLRKWRAEGGGSQLGYPTTDTAATADGRGQYSEFANGGVIYWTAETQAHVLQGKVLAKWEETGGGAGPLGYPTTDTTATPDNTGQYNHFENNGSIYWSEQTGAHTIQGPIYDKWASTNWERGPLGYPTTDTTATPDNTGQYNHFENNGSIYWSEQTGAHTIQGAIRDKWASLGWERGPLGYPTTDEQSAADGKGSYIEFAGSDGGAIYSASEGSWIEEFGATHAVYGAIYDKWMASGGVTGPLGYPITDELVGYGDGSGRFNLFSGQNNMFAMVAWSQPTQAHSLQGGIASKYLLEEGGPGGPLGYPTTDQRITPDGQASYNHFNGAGGSSIYFSKSVDRAHAVYGGIRDRWRQLGWERSYLGYPISDEMTTENGNRRVNFQGGYVIYYPETGEIVDRPW
ncbi:hypothetical protein ACOQFL_21065 [Actinopolyspora sp. H202]|uniref:hypothetical protein n=1 Tax=Actinopolyspora sp. H202 TaxID=1500456 RepID=UPI003EE4D7FA